MTNATAHDPPAGHAPEASGESAPHRPTGLERPAWANLWQVPVFVASALLIVLGLVVAGRDGGPPESFEDILAQVEAHISSGELDRARLAFDTRLEPMLAEATVTQQGAYHAAVADWVAASQEVRNLSAESNNRLIAERYERGADLGAKLGPARLERWANALIDLGEIERADERVATLEALAATDEGGAALRERVNRLLRRIVEHSLRREDASQEVLLEALERLRRDPMLNAEDEAWASAQEAALRLEAGENEAAVDHLLLDIRRLEERAPDLSPSAWGRLDGLLARGYWAQGRYDYALWHLDSALDRLEIASPERGEAIYLTGRIAVARGDVDRADELFDEVVRNYVATPAHLPALLARAEVESVRGEHEASLEDYREVVRVLGSSAPRSDVPARSVAASLIDRHDAAITRGEVDRALAYISIAESLFDRGNVPADVLHRLASTSRQIGDDLLSAAMIGDSLADPDGLDRLAEADPALRHEANEHLVRAGEYFIRHARALTAVADADGAWAESLWLAGDCYDIAGERERAIEHFREYVAGRPPDDPRRAEVVYRLAQAQEAALDPASAATNYEQVIREHPRSPFGTQSHVSLARCYVALDRVGEAEQQLREVLEGRYPIGPDAVDYSRALIALGVIHHETGRFSQAIERLEEAIERYPDDARATEVRFRLADSARRHAAEIDARLAEEVQLSPTERAAERARRRALLERALVLFDQACAEWSRVEHRADHVREFERAAWLGRGDCAYALEEWEEAARWYDQAARRYSDDCASLHAIVQTVNCFVRLGDDARAEVAHRNALSRLRQLPDSAFEAPGAILDRTAWEQWLQNRPAGRPLEAPSPALTTAANTPRGNGETP